LSSPSSLLCKRIRNLFTYHIPRLQYSISQMPSPRSGLDPYISRISLTATSILGISLFVIMVTASLVLLESIAHRDPRLAGLMGLNTTAGPGHPPGEMEAEMIHTLHFVGVIFELALGIVVFVLELERVPHISFNTIANMPNTFWVRYMLRSAHRRAMRHSRLGSHCYPGDRQCINTSTLTAVANILMLSPKYRTLADFFIYSSLAMILYVIFMIYNTIHTVLPNPPFLMLAALATVIPLGPAVARTLTTPARLLHSELEYYRLTSLLRFTRPTLRYNLVAAAIALAILLPAYTILGGSTAATLLATILSAGPYLVVFMLSPIVPLNYALIYTHSIAYLAYLAHELAAGPGHLAEAETPGLLMELAMLLLLDSIILLYYRVTKLYTDRPPRTGRPGEQSLHEYYKSYLDEITGLLGREELEEASRLILEDIAIMLHYHIFTENCVAQAIAGPGLAGGATYITNTMLRNILETATARADLERPDDTLIIILNRILLISKVRLQPARYHLTLPTHPETSPDSILAETAHKAYQISEKILQSPYAPLGEPLRSLKALHSEIIGTIKIINKLLNK